MSEEQQHSLGTRTARGMLWAFGSYAGGRMLVLLATAVLARLLTPSDFGLVALALTFIGLLDSLSTFGLGEALVVQKDEELAERADTAFLWSIGFGFTVSAAIAACSPLIARFFDEPQLVGIASALGANLFLRSLGITHYALAQRSLNFRARTVAEFADVIVRGIAGIALALAGFGAWSLVLGYLIGTISMDIAIWALVPWRPRLRSRREHLPQLLRFGGTLSLVSLLAAIGNTIDNIFVGRVLGATALGFYAIAFMVPNLTTVNVSVIAQKVLFPAFAAHDQDDLSRAFLITFRYLWLLALPITLLLVVLAHPIVLVAFGGQWTDAVDAMRILAIYGLALATSFAAGTVYMTTNRLGVLLGLISARLVILVVGLAAFVHLGISAAATCQAVAVGTTEVVGLWVASRLLVVRMRDLWREVRPCIAAAAVMVVPLIAVERLVSDPWLAVIGGGIAATAVYAAVLYAIAPESIRYIASKLVPGSTAQPAPESVGRESGAMVG